MSFTWNELVCHGLLKEIGEREVVLQLMRFVKPMRRDFLEEEAREYHMEQCEKLSPNFPKRRVIDLLRSKSDLILWTKLTRDTPRLGCLGRYIADQGWLPPRFAYLNM